MQVAKRDRAEPQEVASRSDPSRTASDMPAAKRVKGDDATATPSPPAPAAESEALPSDSEPQVTQSVPEPIAISLSHQAETASEMRLDLPHQQQQQTALAADGASLEDQPNVVAPAGLQLRPNQTAAATAMQDSVARVVVVHDHIEVSIQASSIDMPAAEASLAQAGGPAVQPEASPQPTTQPSAVQPEAGSADTADVAMTEATSVADELAPLVKMERQGLEAEDGELAHAAAAAEAMTNADEQAPQAETAAATTAGQDEAGDGDRAGGQKRPPIVFQLPTSVAVESPTPAASGQQPQTEQQQQQAGGRGLRGRGTGASGRGGTAAGASVRNAARGGRKQR